MPPWYRWSRRPPWLRRGRAAIARFLDRADVVDARRALGRRLARRARAGQLGRWVQMPRDLVAASPVALTWVHADNRSSNAYLFNRSTPTSGTSPKDPSHRDGSRGSGTRDGRSVGAGLGAALVRPPRSNARGVRHGAVLFLTAWRRAPPAGNGPLRGACRVAKSAFLLRIRLCGRTYHRGYGCQPHDTRVVVRANVRHILLSSSERLVPVEPARRSMALRVVPGALSVRCRAAALIRQREAPFRGAPVMCRHRSGLGTPIPRFKVPGIVHPL